MRPRACVHWCVDSRPQGLDANGCCVCGAAGFTPALRSGCTAFKGAAVSRPAARAVTGPVMADAWVRVVPSQSVDVGGQADRLVAGAGTALPLLCVPGKSCVLRAG